MILNQLQNRTVQCSLNWLSPIGSNAGITGGIELYVCNPDILIGSEIANVHLIGNNEVIFVGRAFYNVTLTSFLWKKNFYFNGNIRFQYYQI